MSRRPDVQIPTPRLPPDKVELVHAELDRVLASALFRGSKRCSTLLKTVVEHSLAGETDFLRERSLGVEVFNRAADYDTAEDPIVRAGAAEIRKKLAQYYQEHGHDGPVRFELPSGSYLADFHFAQDAPISPLPIPQRKLRTRGSVWVAVVIGVVLLTATAVLLAPRWRNSDLDDMWAPVLRAPGPILICVGLQAAYNFRSAQLQDEVQGLIKSGTGGKGLRPIRGEDLVLLKDRYVALDDALCVDRVTSLLDRQHKTFRIRADQSTSFADLRDTPAVLIGAFDNPWTLRSVSPLRFTFSKDAEHDIGMVHDRDHPENTGWRLSSYWPNWDISQDYAIVTRMIDSASDRPVIIAAGLTQYGTLGAGELLTNPAYFAEAAQHLPKGWQKKNLQLVLRVPVVNHTSGRPRILATHVW